MKSSEEQLSEYLSYFDDHLVHLTQDLRLYFKNETHPAYELVIDSFNSLNIGYGFTKKAWDCYCAIIVYSKHINISLPSGAFLNDPSGILNGSGKRVRHIKLKSLNDLNVPEVKKIISEAKKMAMESLDNSSQALPTHPEIIIKEVSGKKRRSRK